MGRPKLLLRWGDTTVIGHMISLLSRREISQIIVVFRADDDDLHAAVVDRDVVAIQPDDPPPEMRDSVECALRRIAEEYSPQPDDGWLLIPADNPLLDSTVLDRLLAEWQAHPGRIIVPTHQGKRGHPTLFPWSLTPEVFQLPPDQGLNRILATRHDLIESIEIGSPAILIDLDTPDEYKHWSADGGQ